MRRAQLATWVATWVVSWALAATAAAGPSQAELELALRELDADHDTATAAVHELRSGGAAAAVAIRDRWPALSLLGRKRAIDALRSLAQAHDAAVDALVAAARSEDERVRELGFAALQRTSGRGQRGLVALLDDSRVGDQAALVLARAAPDFALPHLLSAIDAEGGADRPALRAAVAAGVRRANAPGPVLYGWLRGQPSAGAAASVALALSALPARHNEVASFVAYGLGDASDFATTWRLLRSAGSAAPSVPIDRWVVRQLTEPEEWMLRAAAVDASAERGTREHVRVALADPYPRVRARAAAALSGDAVSLIDRATLARKDPWPAVRAAAVRSLRTEGEALPVIVASVDDSMSIVRVAAIEVLTLAAHDEGWDRIHRRLRAAGEWPSVTRAAVDYAAAHCRTDAAKSLFGVVMRAAPSNALTEDLNNAAHAIEALCTLGTPEANAMLERLRDVEEVPPTLKMALERREPGTPRCSVDGP